MKLEEIALNHDVSVVDQPEVDMGMANPPRLHGLASHPHQVDRLSIKIGTALLYQSEIEELVEELDQTLGLLADIGHGLSCGGIGGDRVELGKDGCEAGDPRKRRPHVVTDPDKKNETVGQHLLDLGAGAAQPGSPSITPI